ncbi:MAG: hypothetical protein P8J61_04350 [Gammaproteobacteria bacterium]|jgi:basic amino acid/polyamine antiporter, APA family|nr:hypothetical protein [Gammaproteobacteria bacterium]
MDFASPTHFKAFHELINPDFYGLGTIIGAGIYVLIGEVAGVADSYMPLSFLLAGLIALFTALSYAELASRYPVAAGGAVYVDKAWGCSWFSALIGWMIILTGIVSAAAISNGFAGYLNIFIDVEAHWAILFLCIALCGIAVYGINLSASAVFIITVLELGGLAYVVWVAEGMDPVADQASFENLTEASSLNGIFIGAFFTISEPRWFIRWAGCSTKC